MGAVVVVVVVVVETIGSVFPAGRSDFTEKLVISTGDFLVLMLKYPPL